MSWYNDVVGTNVIKQPLGSNIETPEGFRTGLKAEKAKVVPETHLNALKKKKAWDIATGPAKQLPMTLFMNYMSGNSLQMIPISMTLMLFAGAFKAIFDVNKAFNGLDYDSSDLAFAKITFIFFQLVTVSVGIYKLNSMGLIPNQVGDWMAFDSVPKYLEKTI